jgi:hypothetical protein
MSPTPVAFVGRGYDRREEMLAESQDGVWPPGHAAGDGGGH